MAQRAATFHFSPTPMGGGSGDYLEFPRDADPILRVIYQLRGVSEGGSAPGDLEQGAPSTISSSAASNSDSGIGGRDTDALLPQVVHSYGGEPLDLMEIGTYPVIWSIARALIIKCFPKWICNVNFAFLSTIYWPTQNQLQSFPFSTWSTLHESR